MNWWNIFPLYCIDLYSLINWMKCSIKIRHFAIILISIKIGIFLYKLCFKNSLYMWEQKYKYMSREDSSFYFFSSFLYVLSSLKWRSQQEMKRSRRIKYQKEVNPKPCHWIYTLVMKNDRLAAHTQLVPTCSLFSLPKLFILNCSIFKVTAWFHIHNLSCMNVQLYFSSQTNRLLGPRMLTTVLWAVIDLFYISPQQFYSTSESKH